MAVAPIAMPVSKVIPNARYFFMGVSLNDERSLFALLRTLVSPLRAVIIDAAISKQDFRSSARQLTSRLHGQGGLEKRVAAAAVLLQHSASDHREQTNGGASVVVEAERADAIARITQVVASAQERFLHLLVGE